MVASMADQNSSSMKAIQGPPGWRELESSMAKGDVTRFFRVRHNSPTPSRSRPQIQPTNRSEEHTSELQSLAFLVCRLLLEKKKTNKEELDIEYYVHH